MPSQAPPGGDDEAPSTAAVAAFDAAAGDPGEAGVAAVDLTRESNGEDIAFYGVAAAAAADPSSDRRIPGVAEDCEVDIEGMEINGSESTETDPDVTEHSSSFGDSFSGTGEESDGEVQSFDNGGIPYDEIDRVFKKKRVTDHWRRFIRPIMWRCQWLELQMKELKSHALKYDKELDAYKHEKQLHAKVVELHSSASRTVPLTSRSAKKKVMRRQTRKKIEDTADISAYMSNHSIFSYYENKRVETDAPSLDNDFDDQDENGHDDMEWSVLRFRFRDRSLEQILWDIEAVQTRVVNLKNLISEEMCKNDMDISSTPSNLFPGDLPSSGQSPSFSAGINGSSMPLGEFDIPAHHFSDYDNEDMVIPGSAVSSYGDVAELDTIDSSMGLFGDLPMDDDLIGELCRNAENDVLINNQMAEEELQVFNNVTINSDEPQVISKEEAVSFDEASSSPPTVTMPHQTLQVKEEGVDELQQQILKPCYTGKKRGRKPKKKRRGGFASSSGVKK